MTTRAEQSDARNFVAWLLEEHEEICAVAGSPRDTHLSEYADKGFLMRGERSPSGENSYWMNGSKILQAFANS